MNTMLIARRGFATAKAAQAAAAAQRKETSPVARSPSFDHPPPAKQELKVTRLPNDLLVASEDSGFALTRISVAVKAGARHEPVELPGLSHVLRNAAPLATKQCTAFGLSRNLEQLGANLRAITTRDLTVYSLEVTRDNLHDAVKFLSYVVTQQEFKPWEVLDARERLLVDLAILKKHPEIRLVENLHKAAYNGGLSNSLYARNLL
ncbi:putative Cytochrome b-c1 complex subunit 2, mitochondrial [Hypsibius exemplaris]|uniref:Cytochrome b-c1 complex subunit 2, mitochondrial n=1 Tax=Hypsibius exemplaris TaxID=2072580 RepID=A0A1W0WN80_HYPEX|nr:putative Cytochrome b-c1 complex subunit 2, mitochondrial [Hypsibius exemplaris]